MIRSSEGLHQTGRSKAAATRGPGSSWPGSAAQAAVFSGFQYLTPPLHADMTVKEKALALTTPVTAKPGRYRPTDTTLAFLESL
jgi:hypothetical protein